MDKSEGQISNNWFDKDGVNEDAAEELSGLDIDFNFSKPKKLIMKLISLKSDKTSTILDFFAGFRVIIMTQANSQVNTRVLKLLPKFKIKKMNRWCAV